MWQTKTAVEAGGDISVRTTPGAIPGVRTVSAPAVWAHAGAAYRVALIVFLIVSRCAVAPRYLYYFDSANFALALREFNPALHQPQPPGYPLFVALIRLIHLAVPDAAQVMLVAGVVGSIAAVFLILRLGQDMFDRRAGMLAAALLVSDPVFWFGGVTNQVRIFLAVGMAGVALLAWRALQESQSPRRLYALFAGLGIAAGFRPIETWLLAPLALWVWYRCGHRWRALAISLSALAAAALPWLAVTVWSAGGPAAFLATVREYAQTQFEGSSALYGAAPAAASHMVAQAFGWTFLGALVWLWAIPFVSWKTRGSGWQERAIFLALAFVPPFAFSALVHVADPDQALAGVCILAVPGGAVLGNLLKVARSRRTYLAAAMIVAVHVSDFLNPPFHLAEAAGYRAVRSVDRLTTDAVESIRRARGQGPVGIVHWGALVSSRQIAYYFPEDHVIALPGAPGVPAPGQPSYTFHRHHQITLATGTGGVMPHESTRLICLAPSGLSSDALPGWRKEGAVYVLDATEPEVKLGEFRLIR